MKFYKKFFIRILQSDTVVWCINKNIFLSEHSSSDISIFNSQCVVSEGCFVLGDLPIFSNHFISNLLSSVPVKVFLDQDFETDSKCHIVLSFVLLVGATLFKKTYTSLFFKLDRDEIWQDCPQVNTQEFF